MIVFDVLPKDEFMGGESSLTYKERLVALKELNGKIGELEIDSVTIVQILYSGDDASKEVGKEVSYY